MLDARLDPRQICSPLFFTRDQTDDILKLLNEGLSEAVCLGVVGSGEVWEGTVGFSY